MRERIYDEDPHLSGQAARLREINELAAQVAKANPGGFVNGGGLKAGDETPPLGNRSRIIRETCTPRSISQIPPRPWAYGTFLLFGHAAVLGGVDGVGKGAQAVAVALSIITGRELLGEKVWRTGPVVIVSYEDDKIEWERRIAAACIHYNIDFNQVISSFHFLTRQDGSPICFTSPSQNGMTFPDSDEIIRNLREIDDALLIIDPFNAAHAVEDGNSNASIAKVAGELGRIAAASEAAVLVLHHLRKGSTGVVDDLMGATSLRATFRACRILARMTPDEGNKLQLPPDKPSWRHARIAGTKENYAPPPEASTWYRLESVELGNGTEQYPAGDNVQVASLWFPPSQYENVSLASVKEIFDLIRRGPPDMPSEFWLPARKSGAQWVGTAVTNVVGCDQDAASSLIASWMKNIVLKQSTYHSPTRRKPIGRVTLNEDKAAEILGPLYAIPAPE